MADIAEVTMTDIFIFAAVAIAEVALTDIYLCFLLQVAIADVTEAAAGSDILIFVVPHQFVRGICKQLKGKLKPNTVALSLIKVWKVVRIL